MSLIYVLFTPWQYVSQGDVSHTQNISSNEKCLSGTLGHQTHVLKCRKLVLH